MVTALIKIHMENKLQQLTEKLYSEGLAKGQAEGAQILETSLTQAAEIIAQAQAEAAQIIEKAQSDASELKAGAEGELRLAATQMTSELRSQIERMITAQVTEQATGSAWSDPQFIKELIIKAAQSFNPSQANPVNIVVPEQMAQQVRESLHGQLTQGIEIVTDSRLKVPFRIAPANGEYYVSFTQEDFDTLFRSYIRPMVAGILYGNPR